MTRLLLAGIVFVAMVGLAPAQEKKDEKKPDDRAKVEILLATEHLPKDLKAGAKVDLKLVTGKTVGPRGLTLYNTSPVAGDVEVASVEQMDKPANPESAVKVVLLVPQDMVGKVEKTRDQVVTVVEEQVRKMQRVTLRLELPKAGK